MPRVFVPGLEEKILGPCRGVFINSDLVAENEMEVRRRELGDLVNKLNLAAEIYTVLGVAFPIIMIVLLSLMGIFGGEVMGGLGPIEMIKIMSYVLFPLVSVGLILFIDGLTSSW